MENKKSLHISKPPTELSTRGQKRTLLGYFDKLKTVSTENSSTNKKKNAKRSESYEIISPIKEASMTKNQDSGFSTVLDLTQNFHGEDEAASSQEFLSDPCSSSKTVNSQKVSILDTNYSGLSENLVPTKCKKTLGVKRSMEGWSARKRFVPPTLNKNLPPT